jgi:hypothetical protein
MASLIAVLATSNGAPWDILWAGVAAAVFIVAIAGPAAVLNARDRKRRRPGP